MIPKPGDLCLITNGPACGQSVIALKTVPISEVLCASAYATGNPNIEIYDASPSDIYWQVDRKVNWASALTGITIQIEYEWQGILLPIQPPASMT